MTAIPLKVKAPPGGAGDHADLETVRPLFRGTGNTDYVCGCCGAVIAAGMGPTQHVIVDTTVCPGCGAVNEFPPELRA